MVEVAAAKRDRDFFLGKVAQARKSEAIVARKRKVLHHILSAADSSTPLLVCGIACCPVHIALQACNCTCRVGLHTAPYCHVLQGTIP